MFGALNAGREHDDTAEPWLCYLPPVRIDERVHEAEHLLLWQVRGRSEAILAGEAHALPVGHALWIPAQLPHALTVCENSVVLPMFFPVAQTATTLRTQATVAVDRDLRTLMLAFVQSQNTIIQPPVNLARQILALLEQSPARASALPMPLAPAAVAVAQALRFNPGDDRTVEQLAATAHTSSRTVERAFRAETGMTLRRWRIRNRMEAAGLLLRSQASLTAVATRVGYTNVSAFGRAFKQQVGLTPSEYASRYAVQR